MRAVFNQNYDVRLSVTVWAQYEDLFDQKVFTHAAQGIDADKNSFLMTWDASLPLQSPEEREFPSNKVIRVNMVSYFPSCFHLYFKHKEDCLLYILKHGISHEPPY